MSLSENECGVMVSAVYIFPLVEIDFYFDNYNREFCHIRQTLARQATNNIILVIETWLTAILRCILAQVVVVLSDDVTRNRKIFIWSNRKLGLKEFLRSMWSITREGDAALWVLVRAGFDFIGSVRFASPFQLTRLDSVRLTFSASWFGSIRFDSVEPNRTEWSNIRFGFGLWSGPWKFLEYWWSRWFSVAYLSWVKCIEERLRHG